MRRSLCRRRHTSEQTQRHPRFGSRGQSLVEFALVLPVLLLLALGTIDYGRVYFDYISVTNAARNGAVYASTGPDAAADTESIRSAVIEELGEDKADDATVQTATGPDAAGNQYATVTVQYTFRTMISWPGLPSSVHLERSVQMRVAR